MAVLTDLERTNLRNFMERKAQQANTPVVWVKQQINDAAQVICDTLDGTVPLTRTEISPGGTSLPAVLSLRADLATAPLILTNEQKRFLIAKVFEVKFQRDR
jgi:hypothetical protein